MVTPSVPVVVSSGRVGRMSAKRSVKVWRPRGGQYPELLHAHRTLAAGGRRIGDRAVELQILLRACQPGLQFTDGARELGPFAYLRDLRGGIRRQLHAQLVDGLVLGGDRLLQRRALLGRLDAVKSRLLVSHLEGQEKRHRAAAAAPRPE